MKRFSYSARDSQGGVKQGHIDAQDRKSALRELKSIGVIPMVISEEELTHASFKFSARALKYSVAAVILGCVVIGIILKFSVFPAHEKHKNTAGKRVEKKVVKAPSRGTGKATVPAANGKQVIPAGIGGTGSVATAAVRSVKPKQEVPLSPEEEKNRQEEEIRKAPFKTISEQLIAMLGQPGQEMPPLPLMEGDHLIDDFKKALTNMIVILESDEAETVAMKESVAWTKEFIRQAEAEKWTPGDYLRELEKKRKEEAAVRKEANIIMEEVENTAQTQQEIDAAKKELNKELTTRGIIPLEETPAE